ncbi:MAG: HAMP domain-containing protein [Planctomycetes bacterium]|nr:HAMP domain-containing protein [Planctomycetota bacterium]
MTATTAVLTAIVFVVAGWVIDAVLTTGIHDDGVHAAEREARVLALGAVHQWRELQSRAGERELRTIALESPNWALVRGDGRVIVATGLFDVTPSLARPSQDRLLERGSGEKPVRLASVPMFEAVPDSLRSLPDSVRGRVASEVPAGTYLSSRREMRRGQLRFEVSIVEDDHLIELELDAEGTLIERERKELVSDLSVMPDLLSSIRDRERMLELEPAVSRSIVGWRAVQGQLVAVVEDETPEGPTRRYAVNRLGEFFELDGAGTIIAPDDASRLWVITALDAVGEVVATSRARVAVWLGSSVAWGLVVLVGWFVTRRAMSPVRRIVRELDEVEVSKLDARLPVESPGDEFGRISVTINRMLDRIEEGYRRERRFTGDASHELRGPIAKILADLDVTLSRVRTTQEYVETLERCRVYGQGIRNLVDSLLWLARLDAGRFSVTRRSFDLTELTTDLIGSLPEDETRRVELDLTEAPAVVMARGEPDLVRVLFQNLLQNALRHSPETEPVAVRLQAQNGHARVVIDDLGPGIPEGQIRSVFARFFRLDKARSRRTGGVGLGLAIVDEIARVHGTEVRLTNRAPRGLQASFDLPRHA